MVNWDYWEKCYVNASGWRSGVLKKKTDYFYLLMVVRLCCVGWIEVGWDIFFSVCNILCLQLNDLLNKETLLHHYSNSEGQSDFLFLSASMSLLHLHFLLCNNNKNIHTKTNASFVLTLNAIFRVSMCISVHSLTAFLPHCFT